MKKEKEIIPKPIKNYWDRRREEKMNNHGPKNNYKNQFYISKEQIKIIKKSVDAIPDSIIYNN